MTTRGIGSRSSLDHPTTAGDFVALVAEYEAHDAIMKIGGVQWRHIVPHITRHLQGGHRGPWFRCSVCFPMTDAEREYEEDLAAGITPKEPTP